jgi:AraC-like DNA-binding protein
VVEETRISDTWLALIILGSCLVPTGLLLYRRYKKNVKPVINLSKLDYRVKLALDHIKSHYLEEISINQVATIANAHPNWLGKQFKKEIRQDIRNYINQLRCEKAAELLAENKLNISQIGYKVGFNNSEYFNQVFRKHYRKSPSQYRKDILNPPA